MNTITETITVEKAQEYLNTSLGNRPISKSTVHSYADTMKQGKWMLNGVSIIFDVDGHLIDGHHRLHAICVAGVPVRMGVCRGIESEAFTTYDCGLHRTVGQLLALQGVKNYNTVGAVVAANNILEQTGCLWGNNSLGNKGRKRTNSEGYALYCKDPEGYSKAANYAVEKRSNIAILPNSWIGGIYYYLTHTGRYDDATVKYFFDELCSVTESSNVTIELLRRRFIHEKIKRVKLSASVQFALIAKVWNAYVTNRALKTVKYNSEVEEYPKLIIQ